MGKIDKGLWAFVAICLLSLPVMLLVNTGIHRQEVGAEVIAPVTTDEIVQSARDQAERPSTHNYAGVLVGSLLLAGASALVLALPIWYVVAGRKAKIVWD